MARLQRWPELPYAAWRDTRDTLHLWTQVVGKIRLARAPWLNHSWHVALYVTARGLTTSPIPDGARSSRSNSIFIAHVLWMKTSDGQARQHRAHADAGGGILRRADDGAARARHRGRDPTMPCEIADAMPFEQDFAHRCL